MYYIYTYGTLWYIYCCALCIIYVHCIRGALHRTYRCTLYKWVRTIQIILNRFKPLLRGASSIFLFPFSPFHFALSSFYRPLSRGETIGEYIGGALTRLERRSSGASPSHRLWTEIGDCCLSCSIDPSSQPAGQQIPIGNTRSLPDLAHFQSDQEDHSSSTPFSNVSPSY